MPIKLLQNAATSLGIDGIFQGKEKDAKNGTNPKTKAQKMAENEIEHLKTTLDSGMPDSVDMAYNMMYLMGMLTGNDALKSGAFVIKNYGSEAIENRLKKAEAARDAAIKANDEKNRHQGDGTNLNKSTEEYTPYNNNNDNTNDNTNNTSDNKDYSNTNDNDNNGNPKNENNNINNATPTGNEKRPVDNSNPTKTTVTTSETNNTTDNRANGNNNSSNKTIKQPSTEDINKTLNNSKPNDNKGV